MEKALKNQFPPILDVNEAYLGALATIRSEHHPDFHRLARLICFGSRKNVFAMHMGDREDEAARAYRDTLIAEIDRLLGSGGEKGVRVDISSEAFQSFKALEYKILCLAEEFDAIHFVGAHTCFNRKCWRDFELRREAILNGINARLFWWLMTKPVVDFMEFAPNLWSSCAGLFLFSIRPGKN